MTAPSSGPARTTPLARNRYQEGQILRARDLERESDYFLARDRQHNGLAHGFGILLGLDLTAREAGTENALSELELADSGPKPIDLAVGPGAAIDGVGRLVLVPKRTPLSLDLARLPSVLPPDTYRVELYYRHRAAQRGTVAQSRCEEPGRAGVVEESYGVRLTRHDPEQGPPGMDLGAVLDGPTDDPAVQAPITLGLVVWSGTAYVGYSTVLRTYAPVRAQRVRAPDDRAELELRDRNERFAVRFAKMPRADAEDPFTPGPMENRLTVDENGATWIRGDVSVGPDGVGFRPTADTTTPSAWRMRLAEPAPPEVGAPFRKKADGSPLGPDEYAAGSRELRVVFQREAGPDDGTGRHRVVIGMLDAAGVFEPAVVVYDHPPVDTNRGFGIVEICGDLWVRGTTFVHSVAKFPETGDTNEQLDFILRQLAGPLAGVFRAFLTSDPQWLQQFGAVMAQQVATPGAVRTAFINALVGDPGFVQAVTNAAVSAANLPGLLAAVSGALDTPGGPNLPADAGAALLAAVYRRLLRNNPTLKNQIIQSMQTAEQGPVTTALSWLP